ncbi:hypothetical protein HIM_00051 [Hirsutella minnesotensis 3608]|nr:hypothetical protein HIM_00051 [Hirsutella minnesotensis 3608]
MEAVESRASATRPPPLNLGKSTSLRKPRSAAPLSPSRPHRDANLKRTPSRNLDATARRDTSASRLANKSTTRAPLAAPKPLLPVTERRSCEDRIRPRATRDTDANKWDVVPDGSSAGREGRQFTVANVGNNGRIYLRPTVRPAHQRVPQPSFAFPLTPPSTGGLEALSHEKPKGRKEAKNKNGLELLPSQWTPSPSTSPLAGGGNYFSGSRIPARPTRQRRAMSDSTMNDPSVINERDGDAFKVVISRPGDEKRPRTMEDLNPAAAPTLDVNIPSWRIGEPRFTLRGTPLIRGSSYAPTEELHSGPSLPDRSSRATSSLAPESRPRKLRPLALHPPPHGLLAQRGASGLPSPRLLRSTHTSTHLVIESEMFTELTFKPACDDRSIVRYSPSGSVTAATAPRLVAEITSPSFLDYELISDFFLTFRSFLDPTDLLRMLVARLRWSLIRDNEVGTIVRVRTFVAIRHWILNYFLDDFVLEYDLRATFCHLLNEFVDEISQDAASCKVQLKILAELKKCWRRVCAEHWDGPQFDDSLGPEVPIAPGGIAGQRNPNLDPGYWEREGVEPPRLGIFLPVPKSSADSVSFYPDGAAGAPISDFIILGDRPGTPEGQVIDGQAAADSVPGSPLSMASVDVVSCSFPSKFTRANKPEAMHPMNAHPVPSTSVTYASGQVATTPKVLAGKRARPSQSHKRNISISDSLREHGSDKGSSQDHDCSTTWPSAGSLVRGDILPPSQAFVHYDPHGSTDGVNRSTTLFHPKGRTFTGERAANGAMSGHGMRKLLGNVRRALRTRGQAFSPWHAQLMGLTPVGPSGASSHRLPGTAIVPQDPPRHNGGRPPVRIDLLGAEVAEDFKKAIREEEAAAEADRLGYMVPPNSAPPFSNHPEYSAAHMDFSTFDSLPQNQRPRPVSDMGITVGSKSIVIVDDTLPFEVTSAQGRSARILSPPAGNYGDTFTTTRLDPTPPDTPPTVSERGSTQKRPSYPSKHAQLTPLLNAALPPFIPDMETLGEGTSTRELGQADSQMLAANGGKPSMQTVGTSRLRRDNLSAATLQSLDSIVNSRYGSINGSIIPSSAAPSFQAAPESNVSFTEDTFDAPEPAPLRVLRRRPGGDLRAAISVGDLDRESLRRSLSVGSLATYTESVRSSYLLNTRPNSAGRTESVPSLTHPGRREVFSLGQLAEKPNANHVSLLNSCSSKPIMRPSFEKEAQFLAQIPDDEDDGGIESALLKLEGKYEKKQPVMHASSEKQNVMEDAFEGSSTESVRHREKRANRRIHVLDEPVIAKEEAIPRSSGLTLDSRQGYMGPNDAGSLLSDGSHESCYSIPLLERGFADDGTTPTASRERAEQAVARGYNGIHSEDGAGENANIVGNEASRYHSFNMIQQANRIQRIESTDPVSFAVDGRSLSESRVNGTDISSEISGDGDDTPRNQGDNPLSTDRDRLDIPTATSRATPTQDAARQLTLIQALAMTPQNTCGMAPPRLPPNYPPPTPELSPIALQSRDQIPVEQTIDPSDCIVEAPKLGIGPLRKYNVHLPFIMAFDSDVLAQQLTLIEKDALNDIDWKDLIDMKWKNATRSDSRSWVDFLRHSDAQGVEVVIARFNIMVKWAISEIVLTQQIEERARCIVKLIHIASHCRRYRNFATLAQLTIALSSNEVSRLAKTWQLVPSHDTSTLNSLESLITPTRNFHAIRAEMEMGSDAGCIPFVGIYTHDLLYNAQRPSEIASSPTTPPLINFERCRIGAAIVKTLLRLLEASTRYSFVPIEGITERCLWIGALSDEEIRRRSDGME